jgi:4-amino-4-deoxy-L-arabinose transferase-like glycosyltransferase
MKKAKTVIHSSFKQYLPEFLIAAFYLITHLFRLAQFPVFADESIYIRWAQLIMDDAHQYLFFPMNDGKTPLFIWLLAPLQFLFSNQLWAARLLSVGVGLVQLFIIQRIIAQLGGRRKTQWLGMVLVSILPFWYFYHRVSLMDGMLTLFVSLTFWSAITLQNSIAKTTEKKLFSFSQPEIVWSGITGLFLGLAIWTKVPGIFFIASLPFIGLLFQRPTSSQILKYFLLCGASIFIGLAIFVVLRISPSFGQLFRRSSDFTYPVMEVLQGKWRDTVPNAPAYLSYFVSYLTLPVLLLAIAGLFSTRFRRITAVCLIAALLFGLPFWLFGKVIYARYFLPSCIFLTVASVLNFK